MKKLFFIPAFALLLFTSCEKTANIDVPVTPPMMAVFAFVEDGQPLVIRLEEVVPVFGKPKRQPGSLSFATVIVKEGSNTYTFVEGSSPGLYEHNSFVGQGGKTYHLEVMLSGFPSLKATCTVPTYSPATARVEYISSPIGSNMSGFTDSNRRIGFRWADEVGKANYYRLGAEMNANGSPSVLDIYDKNLNDKGQDGVELFSGLNDFYYSNPGQPITDLKVRLDLMTLDEHAARYQTTFDASYYTGDNPFSEPVIIYTNVSGGLGIFGGVKRAYYNIDVY